MNTDNKQVLQCPTETIFYTQFSFETILLKILSEICQVLCSYTRGVIGISEDWGKFW